MQTAGQVENKLKALNKHGQSIWLDFIRRSFLRDGELKKLVEEDGLRGVTSNPSIFEKAIAGSDDYKEELDKLVFERNLDANDIYERLAKEDIKVALETLKGVYTETAGRDGYVSMEVSPLIASDTEATVNEALRLWGEIDRPNLMIKVPATDEGIPAIEALIAKGLNVNVTLLFSCEAYRKVVEAYMAGLEALAEAGGDLSTVASVASFFVSRIDSKVDYLLNKVAEEAEEGKDKASAKHLLGKVAIANAKAAYQIYRELFTSERWKNLVSKGARPQRLLWASTSTKNPEYPDTLYVEQLVGNETVNTIPLDTLNAFREHGVAEEALERSVDEAKDQLNRLLELGISLSDVTDELLTEGVASFAKSFEDLLSAVELVRSEKLPDFTETIEVVLPESMQEEVSEKLLQWQAAGDVKKLWTGDASLWTDGDESNWLEWMNVVDVQLKELEKFKLLKEEVKNSAIENVLLLGMGGSSLCPEVLSMTFGQAEGFPRLRILDSTSPEQIEAVASELDLKKTLCVVASKSGSTLEPNIFMSYFYERMKEVMAEDAASHFLAITDPGSKLDDFARQEGFKHVFYGDPQIGGRYSALSDFGMIPAALMGIPVEEFLTNARSMADACAISSGLEKNPGVYLGIVIGVLAINGIDKLTIATSCGISDFGAWLEQLVAESTGKDGKAIIPVDREHLGSSESYGKDRVFVYVKLQEDEDSQQEEAIVDLEKAGYPVIKIQIKDRLRLGQEFFRWEIATAVAGSLLGINPFNQPDVEASKIATRALTKAYETAGSFPPETPVLEEEAVSVFVDQKYLSRFSDESKESLVKFLGQHISFINENDYFGLLAYIHMDKESEQVLQNIRHSIRDSKKVATCLGFGPRFLHSTGQAYKGGPNSGVFIQLTCHHQEDLAVPDHAYSFGVVIDAQAKGDLEVLTERERRVVRIHLRDVSEGLSQLRKAITEVLT